jgi:hypothetical protein
MGRDMFVFVVPFKGRACCSNWSIATQLCNRAINSMLAAPSAIKVILVCSELPDELPIDSRLIVKSVATTNPRTRHEMMEDKYFKIKVGLTLAREFAPAWLMRADADDLISRRLVPFVEQQRPHGAWYSATGWFHNYGSRWVFKERNFHLLCGTSCVTYVFPSELPDSVERPSKDYYLLTQGHNIIVDFLMRSAVPTNPVPFPTTVYVLESGENWSGRWLKELRSKRTHLRHAINSRLITQSIRDEFGLFTARAVW